MATLFASERGIRRGAIEARPGSRFADRTRGRSTLSVPSVETIGLIDTSICNLDSISRALLGCGAPVRAITSGSDLSGLTGIVLPGVGSFIPAMSALRERGLDLALKAAAESGLPILGVCLGMQLMASQGHEGGEHPGLGLIAGDVVPLLPIKSGERSPHVGWNSIDHDGSSPILMGVDNGKDFYFTHSYKFLPSNPSSVIATTPYCGQFCSIVNETRLFGVQFHPEKSQECGNLLLKNFINFCRSR